MNENYNFNNNNNNNNNNRTKFEAINLNKKNKNKLLFNIASDSSSTASSTSSRTNFQILPIRSDLCAPSAVASENLNKNVKTYYSSQSYRNHQIDLIQCQNELIFKKKSPLQTHSKLTSFQIIRLTRIQLKEQCQRT